VKDKIRSYYKEFQEDFEGANGRTKKTLWLTEVAMGSNNGTAITRFVEDLMNSKDGLTNRNSAAEGGFGYVERVSWFSEFNFASFSVSNSTPAPFETWSSSLFDPFGSLSQVGEAYFQHCNGTTPRQ